MDAARNPFRVSRVKPGAVPYQFSHSVSQRDTTDNRSERDCIDVSARPIDRSWSGECRSLQTDEDCHWASLQTSLRSCQVGAIVGPHGTGKSTLIQTWLRRLQEEFDQVQQIRMHDRHHYSVVAVRDDSGQGDFCFPSRQHDGLMRKMLCLDELVAGVSGDSLVIIDGAEQLSRVKWLRLLGIIKKRGLHMLVTSHRRLLGSSVVHRTRVSADLIQILTQQLIADADCEAKSIVTDYLRHNDLSRVENLRDFWFDLYDQIQGMTTSPPDIDRKPIGKPLNRAAVRETLFARFCG